METVLTSVATYVAIDLVSLAILVAFKDKFIMAARFGFQRLGIQPVVNNYNTYSSPEAVDEEDEDEDEVINFHEEDEDEDEDEDETTQELLDRMGGDQINYGWDLSEEGEKKNE